LRSHPLHQAATGCYGKGKKRFASVANMTGIASYVGRGGKRRAPLICTTRPSAASCAGAPTAAVPSGDPAGNLTRLRRFAPSASFNFSAAPYSNTTT